MKKTNITKILSLSLAALICFTGCKPNTSSSQTPTSSETPVSSQAPTSSQTPAINYGTETAPLTIAEVKTICDSLANDTCSEQKGYVTGVVKTAPTKNKYGSYEFYLDGGEIEFQVYSAKLADGVAEPKVGDTIVVYGYFKKYNSTYEVAHISDKQDSPSIVSVVAGSGTTTPDNPSNPDNPTNWGTASDPLTVEEAVAAMSSFSDDEYSTTMGYLTGKVISKEYSTQHSNWTFGLECPSGVSYTSKIYGAELDTNVSEPNVGDTIVGYGYFEKYVSSSTGAVCYELAYHPASKTSPKIISVTSGSGTTTPDNPSNPDTNYGTQDAPLSISEARALAAQLEQSDYNASHYSTNIIHLTGKVKSISPNKTYYNLTLTDDQNNTFDIYSGSINTGIDFPVAGDTVVASGYYCNFKGTYQLGYANNVGAKVLSTTHNNYAVSYSVVDGNDVAAASLATVTGLDATAVSGSTQEFTITPASGYKVSAVTVNSVTIEPNNNKYSFIVTNENVIKISIIDENSAAPVTEVLPIAAVNGTVGTDTISWTGSAFTFTNNKASSTNDIRTSDSDHFRIYAHSEIVLTLTSGTKIKDIQFTISEDKYITPMINAATGAGYTASSNGKVVTISNINSATFKISDVGAQTRITKISVTYFA